MILDKFVLMSEGLSASVIEPKILSGQEIDDIVQRAFLTFGFDFRGDSFSDIETNLSNNISKKFLIYSL